MNCIKKLPWSAGKYIDTRKYYPQDRVYCDGSIYASLAEQVGNKPYFKQDSDGTYTVAPGWALLAAGLLEDNGLGYDYEVLENLPSVNGVVLMGDKTPEELGLYSKVEADGKFETKSHAADTFQTKESAAEADKRVQGMLDGKVDKEPGKDLSANDLTDERAGKVDKLKIDGRANEYLNGAGIYSRPVRQGYGVSVADDNTVSVDPQVIARQSDVANVAADLAAQKAAAQLDHRVVAEAIVSLAARLDALEGSRGLLGDATAGTVDVRGLTRCSYPLVMLGHGVPAEANVPDNLPDGLPWDGVPAFVGQNYINLDAASGGLYYAAGVDSVADWKQA